ncbi:MAG: zf-HC2 domain-containing protein [Magnetococcales bacterium]|nr:zf-HC2 domain-containing protein [Magnetococcales bacterium]
MMTNECNPELVSAFLDNELDQIILGRVTRHLMHCDHCCKIMSRLAQVRDAVAEKFTLCDPESLTQSVMLAISNEKSISPRDRGLRDRLLRFGLPAMLVGAIMAGTLPETMEWEEHVENQEIIS